jgi:IS66 C-terminal element
MRANYRPVNQASPTLNGIQKRIPMRLMQEQCAEVGKAFHKSCAIAPHVMAYVIGAPGSNAGGRRAAAIYSLIESAKLNALNPQHYLADVLARIAAHPARRIAELLPWNWQPLDATRAAA